MASTNQKTIHSPPILEPMYTSSGVLSTAWATWFQLVYLRIGKAIALTNVELEQIYQADLDAIRADIDLVEASVDALEALSAMQTIDISKLRADIEAINLEPRS